MRISVDPQKLDLGPVLVEFDCGASGACGYNCIAAGTSLVRGSSWDKIKTRLAAMGTTLRVQTAQHITNHPADYKGLWVPDGETTEDMEDGQVAKTWDEWLTCIRRHKRWICALTIKAASARLGVQVIVVQKQGDAWVSPMAFGKSKKGESPVIIGLKKDEGHYVLLRLREGDSVPAGWTTAGQSDFVTTWMGWPLVSSWQTCIYICHLQVYLARLQHLS